MEEKIIQAITLWHTALTIVGHWAYIDSIPVLHWTLSRRDSCFVICFCCWCAAVQVKVTLWWRWETVKFRSEMISVWFWYCCPVMLSMRDELHVRDGGRDGQKILVEQRRLTELPSNTSTSFLTFCWSRKTLSVGLGGDAETDRDAVKYYKIIWIIISNKEGI